MTPQEIQAAIANLQNQLLYTQGNMDAQNNINQQIAQLTSMLVQHQQQVMQQQQYRQPQFQNQMQQQVFQQPMYQQQVFQQPQMQQPMFQQTSGHPSHGNVATSTVADNTRYGSRKDSYMDKYAVNKPEVVIQPEIQVKPKIPLDGYETELFLEFGLVSNIIELGDYYKYEVVTTMAYTPSEKLELVVSDKPISKISADAISYNNIICTTNHIIHRNISDLTVLNTYDNDSILKLVDIIHSDNVFGVTLDVIVTNTINKLLRYYVGYVLNESRNSRNIISIDSVDDILDIIKTIDSITVMDTKNRINNIISYITKYIKNIISKKTDNGLATLTIKYDTLFICNHDDIRAALLDYNGTKMVTPESYGTLYNMLTTMLKDGKTFNNTRVARIAYNNEIGGVVYINVYATPNNMFIIERD